MPTRIILQDVDANTAEVRPSGALLVNPSNAWPGNIHGLREAYLTTTSTTSTQARSSTWADPGNGGQRSVKSSSNNDGAGTNTGALSIRVTYYRSDGSGPFVEDIDLNGTTAVAFVETDLRFVEHVEVLTVGSNGAAIGNIDIFANSNGTGSVLGRINAGENRTYYAHHWIPAGKTMYVSDIIGGLRSTGALGSGSNGRLFARLQRLLTANAVNQDVIFGLRRERDAQDVMVHFDTPVRVEGPGLLVLWVRADGTASTEWFVGVNFYEE